MPNKVVYGSMVTVTLVSGELFTLCVCDSIKFFLSNLEIVESSRSRQVVDALRVDAAWRA
jgi:hypothetical protein